MSAESLTKAIMAQNQFHAIHLRSDGTHAIVEIEVDGKWIELCRERLDCPFGHIVEPSGIAERVRRAGATP